MADVKKIATRESYGNALKELGAEHADLIVFDADLAGATKTGTFKKAFPERHFDCGIREQHDRRCRRCFHHGACAFCLQLRHVHGGPGL